MALLSFEVEDAVPNNDAAPTFDAEPVLNLDHMTLQQLLTLRGEVEKRLPAKKLRDLSLERELVLQLLASQELQSRVLQDPEIPPNQAAQVANSTAAVLQQLIKLQEVVHTTERLKRIENRLIECLNTMNSVQQEAFLSVYEEILGDNERG